VISQNGGIFICGRHASQQKSSVEVSSSIASSYEQAQGHPVASVAPRNFEIIPHLARPSPFFMVWARSAALHFHVGYVNYEHAGFCVWSASSIHIWAKSNFAIPPLPAVEKRLGWAVFRGYATSSQRNGGSHETFDYTRRILLETHLVRPGL
jgi:hypothetical protein